MEIKNKILITGGTGMVGSAMKNLLPGAYYPTRQEMNLLESVSFSDIDDIIHLAAKVGGIKANIDYVGDFYFENNKINQNILRAAKKAKVKKVVSLLSDDPNEV